MLPNRFLDKVSHEPNSGCWLWTAATNNKGYGVLFAGSKRDKTNHLSLAHRFAYQSEIGPIPDGKELDHLCHNPACVNPNHLEPKTHGGNMQNSKAAIKQFCKNGHERTEANTHIRKDRNTKQCKVCNTLKNRAAWRRRKEIPDGESSITRLS